MRCQGSRSRPEAGTLRATVYEDWVDQKRHEAEPQLSLLRPKFAHSQS